jgi:hypothetical protein
MLHLLTRVAVAVCVCALLGAAARDAEFENAQTAGEINTKRDKACKNLKGDALQQCLNGYVGPEPGTRYGRDSVYSGKQGGTRPKSLKGHGDWTRPGRS